MDNTIPEPRRGIKFDIQMDDLSFVRSGFFSIRSIEDQKHVGVAVRFCLLPLETTEDVRASGASPYGINYPVLRAL